MSNTPALSCKAALAEMDRLHPGRSRASDGIMADQQHTSRSDHFYGNAFDLTHDPGDGVDTYVLADELRKRCKAGIEHRVKYIISNRRIASTIGGWVWRAYDGTNPHSKHMHVSIYQTARTDTSPWWTAPRPAPQPQPEGDSEMNDADWNRLSKLLDDKLRLLINGKQPDGKLTHINNLEAVRRDVARLDVPRKD